jgi:hypothetical protein
VGPRRLAAGWLRDAKAAVDGVVDGPLSREQPLGQPVAAGPANVGENCPKLDVVTALAWAPVALPVAAAAPPKAPSSSTGSDSNDSCATRLRMMLACKARKTSSLRAGNVSPVQA